MTDFWSFLLSLIVVALPAIVLERTAPRWAWRYVVVVLLMMVVINWPALVRTAAFVRREVQA